MTEIKAKIRFLRLSPRKSRLVADLIRGLSVEQARNQLSFSKKAAARPMLKLVNSAVADGLSKKMSAERLYIKSIVVDGGPILKRWKPRAFGRATPIRKRSCHITIILAEQSR